MDSVFSGARFLAAALLLAAPMPAAPRTDPWIRIRSADFELFTTAGERHGRDLIRFFEQVHRFFEQAFGLGGTTARPVRIISFRSAREYKPYQPNEVADAFYQPGFAYDYIVMKTSSGELFPTAIHEYTHLLLRQTKLEIPQWLNEGLAELYSSLESTGPQVVVGKLIPGRVRALNRQPWIDLRSLVAAGPDSPLYQQKGRAEMFYAESWALVHMLSLDDRYSPRLRAMIDALQTTGTATAFQKAYGKPIERVQSDLEAYFRGSSFNAAVFDLELPAAVDRSKPEAGAELPARLALAELLSNDRTKLARARAAYAALSHDYENRWEVEQGWGEFLARERRNSEALQHFTRAAGLGCDDPRMYVAYARILNMSNRAADAIAALKTAIRMDPASNDAHFELAVALVRAGSYGDALAEFHQIRNLPPEHAYRYFYNLAYAHYKLGDNNQARALIDQARSATRNPEETAALDHLLQSMNRK